MPGQYDLVAVFGAPSRLSQLRLGNGDGDPHTSSPNASIDALDRLIAKSIQGLEYLGRAAAQQYNRLRLPDSSDTCYPDFSSFPRTRESRATFPSSALGPRFRGGDDKVRRESSVCFVS